MKVRAYLSLLLLAVLPLSVQAQTASREGQSVLKADALISTPIGGLEQTHSSMQIVPAAGQSFAQALHVTIGDESAETNATQLSMPIATPVAKGDVLLASFFMRGASRGAGRAQVMLLFERAVDPWTKSVISTATSPADARVWKRFAVPFTAAEAYQPGEAMVSLRLAFGPQTVEVGGLSVVDFGSAKTPEALLTEIAHQDPLGAVQVNVQRTDTRQTLLGLGGDFCEPRYGSVEPMDATGQYNLAHLHVAQARVGIPLNDWVPERGVYHDDAQAHATFLQMQDLSRRGIPIIGTVWEGPAWMLPGKPEQHGRTLALEEYGDCIDAIAQFLVKARDRYGVSVSEFSFNEPDAGINFRFTPAQMAAFIRQAGPRFRALGLTTRFLVGDTTGGAPLSEFTTPLLADRSLAPYLGPLAFHCWDVLGATDAQYENIASLARRESKPVWCTEGGYDAQLWQANNPWGSWENGLKTAEAYVKTLRLSGASVIDYWTYQNNYPIVEQTGQRPYPVFSVIRQMEDALPPGGVVVGTASSSEDLWTLATIGPKTYAFSVLLVSPVGGASVTLSGLPPGVPVMVSVSTEEAQGSKLLGRHVSKTGSLTLTIPPRAFATVQSTR